jgi:DNA-binding transcriptional regulator YhcF (GntR family)
VRQLGRVPATRTPPVAHSQRHVERGSHMGAPVVVVDADSPLPPYEQVRDQIAARVQSGELAPGTKLPTVRGLAADLGLAANTVARAYRDLESLGLIETRGRAGSVVTGNGVEQAARQAAHEYAETIRALGLDPAAGIDLARRALE